MVKKALCHPFILFPVISCIFFWPFTFQLLSLKNDALTYYYPIRTLISDALNNGELPLWTPYINMGYPLHADLQSGAWNPVIWLFSLCTRYSLAAFHWEFLFYVSFAGLGFYYLCRGHGAGRRAAFVLALSYQFSGFVIDSAQFFSCISSAAYLPFIVLFFSRALRWHRWQDALCTGAFLSLLFTGGYPSIFITSCYVLLNYALIKFARAENRTVFIRRQAGLWVITLLCFVLLSLPAMISFAQYLPLIKRGSGLSLAAAQENSMHPSSIVSLLAPYANTANLRGVRASILMQSIYIGFIPLILLIAGVLHKKIRLNKTALLLLAGSMFFLALAFGAYFFMHAFLYRLVPFMDSFRHPGVYRLFFIFLSLLATNSYISQSAKQNENSALLKKTIAVLFIILMAGGLVLMIQNGVPRFTFSTRQLSEILRGLDFYDRYLIQFPFAAIILFLFYRSLQREKNNKWLCLLAAADLFVFVQLCMPVTVTGARSMAEVEQALARNHERFPLPGNKSINENSFNSEDLLLITGSKIPFSKKMGRNTYFITPGNLQLQDSFYASAIRNRVFDHSLLYRADTVTRGSLHSRGNAEPAAELNRGVLSTGDAAKAAISILNFSANQIFARLDANTAGKVVLLQNFYPGWKAFADGNATSIEPVNITFMGVTVPPGTKELKFVYQPLQIIFAWYTAALAWAVFLILILRGLFLQSRAKKRQKEMARTVTA